MPAAGGVMGKIVVAGTADTKGEELLFLAHEIRAAGGEAILVDVGTKNPTIDMDVSAKIVAGFHPEGSDAVFSTGDRGTAVAAMAIAFSRYIGQASDVSAIIGIGGGGGTSIITAGMRILPLGIPKIMVSTLASGDTAPYVDISDIIMMPSVTDLAGLNGISRIVLHNAARAIAAMAAHPATAGGNKTSIGLTMFGVTTACVTAMAAQLRDEFDCMVFHATGTGGRTMEKLVDSGLIKAVCDMTTTEVCDLLLGGVLPATTDRFGALARTGTGAVVSVGALDMVNFWAPETVPGKYAGRLFYKHNSNVTLMRTLPDENREIGRWIAGRLNQCNGPIHLLIPEKGVSALDVEGGAFFDPEADAALFEALESTLKPASNRQLTRLPYHINDPQFADAAVARFRAIVKT